MIRVMIVDDSAVARALVLRWLAEAPDIEVVAEAENGRVALALVGRAMPDVIVLDLDMPDMDGLTALPDLVAAAPKARVLVVSTLTRRNAEISFRCLSLGAADYVPKPSSRSDAEGLSDFRSELIGKITALAGRQRGLGPSPMADAPAAADKPRGRMPPACLLIGASTGGPRAIMQLLAGLAPAVLQRLPVFIVQHMPPIFTTVFAEHLGVMLKCDVHEARDGEAVRAGTLYLAPGGQHMGLTRRGREVFVRVHDAPPVHSCRPAVDVLFEDAARVYGAAALAVVLTGMGHDGEDGARSLAAAGASIIVQDEATSTVWGMPGTIARAGLACAILPLGGIAPAITTIIEGAVDD